MKRRISSLVVTSVIVAAVAAMFASPSGQPDGGEWQPGPHAGKGDNCAICEVARKSLHGASRAEIDRWYKEARDHANCAHPR